MFWSLDSAVQDFFVSAQHEELELWQSRKISRQVMESISWSDGFLSGEMLI